MSKHTSIERPVIVETEILENSGDALALVVARCNNRNVGVPIMSAANAEYLELIGATPTFDLHNSTVYTIDETTKPYYYYDGDGAASALGVAVEINDERLAIPLYSIEQKEDDVATITFNSPTLVADMEVYSPSAKPDRHNSLLISIDRLNYGIPLFTYNSVLDTKAGEMKEKYPEEPSATSGMETSAIEAKYAPYHPTTIVGTGKPTIDVDGDHGSTFVNSKIKAYSDLIDRVKRIFGWPSVEIDLCDENIAEFVDQAIEVYTKYAGYTDEYLIFDSRWYKHGIGIRMDRLFAMTPEMRRRNLEKAEADWDYDLNNYRKVLDVFSVSPGEQTGANSLFTFEYTLAQQTYYGFMGGSMSGFDLVTWNCVKNWLDVRAKVLGLIPSFRFEPQNQYLRIYPEPNWQNRYCGIVSCYVTKPLNELIQEYWIYEYVCALVSVAVGRIRSKYQFQLLGGATLNGENLLQMGLEKKKELEEQIWKGQGWVDNGTPMFFSM